MKAVSLYRPASIVDELLESFFDSPLAPFAGNRILNKLPLVDVQETGNAYLVEAELPGLDEKQIKVHMDGGKLTIESEQNEQADEQKDGSYLIRERRKASFSRSFTLPENADPESVSAVFKNGVLSLEIKKRTESAKRLIEINAQ
ncbi:MAG: Hsp20/alpha crystallin family protein [Spirochaetaceae bacterium]|jgi:HSP20 family protein|nr:Hsp20/alpha crystallin family protein [Spirochaetaceae bacterium]